MPSALSSVAEILFHRAELALLAVVVVELGHACKKADATTSCISWQDPTYPPGDVVQDLPIEWVRYDDPEVKTFKLNAERQNGRAAMFGILGMISHSALGVDALFPIVQ